MNNTNLRNIAEIDKIMKDRRKKFNNQARQMMGNNSQLFNTLPENNMELNNINENDFMNNFNEQYYLNDNNNNNDINANLRQFLSEDKNKPKNGNLKNKSLELESLIVDSLARNNYNRADRIFKTLEQMYDKFDNEDIRDTYFRVLNAMPKKPINNQEVYSYRQDKNNFKDILDEMHKKENIKAFNENNECISSLGLMWEECDRNICSDRCKDRILNAQKASKNEDCSRLVTGTKKDKNNKDVNILMTDDIKDLIIERLRYCKKIAQLKEGNFDVISYSDKTELKQKTINEIFKLARMANIHYSSCSTNAADFLQTDTKYKEILNLLKSMDLSKLDLERLQSIRNDLTKLPNCSQLAYEEYDKKRDENIKNGIKVGKYIIPKNSDYYNELKDGDKPVIYKDLVTEQDYLYDSFSKTLTQIDQPISKENVNVNKNKNISKNEIKISNNQKVVKKINIDNEDDIEVSPAPSFDNKKFNEIVIKMAKNEMKEEEEEEKNNEINKVNNSLIFGLSGKNIMEYVILILIVVIVIYLAAVIIDII